MDLLHLFSLPLHANPGCLDPCINLNFFAVPITKNTVGLWTTSEVRSSISERRLPPLPIELSGHNKEIQALAFTNCSKHCLASSCSEKILLWDLSSLEEQPKSSLYFPKPGALNVMCFNNNDNLIAAGKDSQVFLFERGQSTCKAVLEAHSAMVSGVKFCPHYSATLVSISDDRTVCMWDTDKSILLYQSAIISSSPLISLDMNLCEPHVAIGSADGYLRIFDLTDGHGFRQLVSLDVASQIKKKIEKCNGSRFENKITPAIVSKKSKFSQKCTTSEQLDPYVEASESLLHLEYTYSVQSHNNLNLLPNVQGQFSGAGNLIGDIPALLIVVSTNNIIHFNSRTLEIINITNFQHSLRSASFSSSLMIGPLSYAASKQLSPSQFVVVVGTLFDRKIHVLEQTLLDEKFQNLQPYNMIEGANITLEYDNKKEDDHLNIVAIDAVLESSPLKAEMLPPVRKSLTTKGDVATGKKKLISSMNQPLTFKSKVKSSGYTTAPRTTMFKPETIKSKLLGQEKTCKKKMSQVNTGAVKMLTNEYDVTKGTVNQVCNTLEVDRSNTAVLSLQFSDDGSNLACALSNKTALSIKSPFSKHICTSFVGHNNQVNSVYWSNSGNYILTASNDKTVGLWDKDGGDALMVLSYEKGTVKEKVDKKNASSSLAPKNLKSNSGSSSRDNKCFAKEIKRAQFFYMDKFILITHGNELSLFSFYLVPEIDDIKRYETRNRYKLVEKWQTESLSFTTSAAVNKFYSHLVLCTTSGKAIEVYDINKSVRSHVFYDCHTRSPHCVVINEGSGFSSQSSAAYNVIATAAPTDSIKLWDVRSKSCVQALSGNLNKSHACQLAFSPCGNYLASGSEDRCTYIFDLRKGTFCEKLRGHSEVVCSVAFHPAFPLLATGSLDSKVIWYKSE